MIRCMRLKDFWLIAAALVLALPTSLLAADATHLEARGTTEARAILELAGWQGGLIVHIGCGDGRLTAALQTGQRSLIQGLDTDTAQVAAAREYLRKLGLYGKVSVNSFDGGNLPYADNLVNLVVVSGVGHQVSDVEISRVLAPGGVAVEIDPDTGRMKPDTLFSKPWPDEIDHWTHFLHDASGNAVSSDRCVGPPKRLQWDGWPRWSRSHETDMTVTAAVTSGGRLFHTMDEGPIGIHETPQNKRRLPDKCSLVARDAFNGILLWKRPLPGWGSAAWDDHRWKWGKRNQLWSSPLTLPRRLVAVGDRVYVTLGFRACISQLDAATGKTIRELPETNAAEEIVVEQNVLVARVKDAAGEKSGGESIVAVDTETANVLWRNRVDAVADLTLAASNGRVCFHNTRRLAALDLTTGKPLWQTEGRPPSKRGLTAGTLVMNKNVVIFAGASGAETRAADDGTLLWSTKTNTSFRGMPDVFVIDGMAWLGTLTTTGRDLLTGDVKRPIDPGHLYTGGHHARCYRGKATDNYLLWSKRGIEFLDLHGDDHMRHDWVRGTCRYGIIPANGLVYAPPHPCFCYPGVNLTGFNALAPAPKAKSQERRRESAGITAKGQGPGCWRHETLEKGAAYDEVAVQPSTVDTRATGDWPTYRHDSARSGSTSTPVPTKLTRAWKTDLRGKVSPPVVVGNRLFVAEIDSHAVTCLDARKGTRLWTYTASAPVDSPPTVDRRRVVFGCTDGAVYCLRAVDGQLVWRFSAAPSPRRIVSYGRIESAWPVHGSVLLENGIVYFAAGRSSFLDGGLYLYGLDIATGQVRHRARLDGPHPDLSVPCDRAHDMDGSKNDILVSNGRKLFLTQNVFDLALNQLEAPKTAKWGARKTDLHLVATGGFLDDSGFDRLYWMYARRWPGMYVAVNTSKAGQILVFDDTTTYGLHTFNRKFGRSPYFRPDAEGHELFADDNSNEPVLSDAAARRERGSMSRTRPPKWSVTIPVRARAMVLAGKILFFAASPDVIDPDDPYGAFERRKGGVLWAVSTADGSKITEYQLPAPPVFDGLIAAQRKLFLTTTDGCVSCWE